MRTKTVSLTERHTFTNDRVAEPKDFGVAGDWSVHVVTETTGLSQGVDLLRLDNGKANFLIVPTRGMGLWKIVLEGMNVGWHSPIRGPVHPAFVNLGEPSGLGWLDGFDELLVRCGLESNGAPEFDEATGRLRYPLHGRIANKPAQSLTVGFDPKTEEISVTGVVEECRFHFLKLRLTCTYKTKVNSTAISIHDEVENLSASPAEMQLLYHINFGPPLLGAGSQVVGPFRTVVPRNAHAASGLPAWDRFAAPQAGYEEQVYFTDLHADEHGNTQTLLRNAQGTQGVSLTFNTRQLPCFSLWKNTTAEQDGCVTGLEPGTNYPNPRSFEGKQGRVKKLGPGEKTNFDLQMVVRDSVQSVVQAEREIEAIAAGRKAEVHEQPLPSWCAM